MNFKKISGLFFDDAPAAPKKEKDAPAGQPAPAATKQTVFNYAAGASGVTTADATVTSPAPVSSGNATQDAMDFFNNLLKEKNFPGMDFLEFQEATLDENLKAIPNESGRYQAAFVGMKMAGVTKEKLVETANQYVALIDGELVQIEQSFQQAFQDRVLSPRQQIEKLNAEMQELSRQIEEKNAEVSRLNAESAENENLLSGNKNSFVSAAALTKDRLTKEIEKINTYIK